MKIAVRSRLPEVQDVGSSVAIGGMRLASRGKQRTRMALVCGMLMLLPLLAQALKQERCTAADAAQGTETSLRAEHTSAERERERLARAGFRESDAPGMILVVFGPEQRHFSFMDGKVQRKGEALSMSSRWPLGRGSQLLLHMAVLQLADKGAIELSTPLRQQWPALRIEGPVEQVERITPALLLTHHAGLAQGRLQGLYRDAADADKRFQRSPWFLARPVGELSGYSNQSGQILLEWLQSLTGTSYPEYLKRELLVPIGLNDTDFGESGTRVLGHRDGDVLELESAEPWLFGAHASADDLVRLGQLLLARKDAAEASMSSSARASMVKVQHKKTLDLDVGYGFGFTVTQSERKQLGDIARVLLDSPGTQGELRLIPSLNLGMLALANAAESARPLAESARDVLDCTLLQQHGITPMDNTTAPPENIQLPKGFQADVMASHYSTSGGLLEFVPDGDGYTFDAFGLGFSARLRGDGWYSIRYDLFGALPLRFGFLKRILLRPARLGEKHYLIGWFFGNRVLLGSTFQDQALDPDARALIGAWELENPDSLVESFRVSKIRISEGSHGLTVAYTVPLVLRFTVRFPLQQRAPDTWVVPGTGALLGEPVKVIGQGDDLRLDFAGYRLRRVD